MRVGIAAAGSGGHVFPALAVAEELREHGLTQDDIVFFGGDRMEATVIPDAGYPYVAVDIHGIRRSLSVDNLRLAAKVRAARDVIERTVRDRSLAAMVVFGGYIAGPAALAARRAGVPLVVHEANAVPGVANRMIARRASRVFTSFEPAAARLPRARVIGSPLRPEFSDFDREAHRDAARSRYGVGADRMVLGVVGGSLGAQFLNDVARDIALCDGRDFDIVHVTGTAHHDAIAAESASIDGWHVLPFEDRMVDLYAASDLVLSRGGALTVSELQATRTPAVIVPLPAGKGYQALNASDLERAGGSLVIEQGDVSTVADMVTDVIGDDDRLDAMRSAASPVDHGKAAAAMAKAILEVADA